MVRESVFYDVSSKKFKWPYKAGAKVNLAVNCAV